MRPALLVALVATLIGALGCRTAPRFTASPTAGTVEDTVTWVALESLAPDDRGELLVVDTVLALYQSRAVAEADTASPLFANRSQLPRELWDAWRTANSEGRRLHLPVRLGGRRVLAAPPVLHAPLTSERYLVTRVGFSGDSALVDVRRHCGPLCGHGQMLLVARDTAREWRVVRAVWNVHY